MVVWKYLEAVSFLTFFIGYGLISSEPYFFSNITKGQRFESFFFKIGWRKEKYEQPWVKKSSGSRLFTSFDLTWLVFGHSILNLTKFSQIQK